MTYPAAFAALIVGLVAGEMLPDVDQKIDLLLHRSAVTHGLLIPLILYLFAAHTQWKPVQWFAMGISVGVAVHLAFDLFPRAWQGYALVSVPAYGRLPVAVSWVWIAVSGGVCLYLAEKLVRRGLEAGVATVGLIGIFVYASIGEHALWMPIAAILVATLTVTLVALATYRPNQ